MADNNLKISILGQLDSQATSTQINKQLKQLEKDLKVSLKVDDSQLKKLKNIKFNVDNKELIKSIRYLKEAVQLITKINSKTVSKPLDSSGIEKQINDINKLGKSIDDLKSKQNGVVKNVADGGDLKSYASLQQRVNEIKKSAQEISKINIQTTKDTKDIEKATISYTDSLGRLVTERYKLKDIGVIDDNNNTKVKEWEMVSQSFTDNIKKQKSEQEKLIQGLNKQIQDLAKTGKYSVEELNKYINAINFAKSNEELRYLQTQLNNLKGNKSLEQDQNRLKESLVQVYNQGRVNEDFFKKFNTSIDSSKNIAELEKLRNELNKATTVNDNQALKDKLINDSRTLERTHLKTVDTKGLDLLIANLTALDPKLANSANRLKNFEKELANFKRSAQEAARSSMTFSDSLHVAMQKFPVNVQAGVKLL